MNRSSILCGFLAGSVLCATAQQSAPAAPAPPPRVFAQENNSYFKTHGFFERSIATRIDEFGNLIQVWTTSEIRDAKNNSKPASRGIDSFQIMHAHGRFWIVRLLFDHERPGVTLPAKYLKTPGNSECLGSAGFGKKLTALFFRCISNAE